MVFCYDVGMLFVQITLFVFGAIVASFIGVVVARLHTGQSFLSGRSYCDACQKVLSSYSLIPIISYLASRGRSRCCSVRISSLSPLTELLLGSIFVLVYNTIGLVAALPFMLSACAVLLALVLYDIAHQILPSGLLMLFVVLSAITGFLLAPSVADFSFSFVTAFCIALSLAAIHFFSCGRAMGFADAPLSFGLALLVGPAALPGFVFSFWIGSIVGIALLAQRPRGTRMGVEVPFAPYLAAGFLLAYFTQWNPFIFAAALH